MALPAHVQAEVQKILDAAARRLLTEQLERDAIDRPSGSDDSTGDGGV